MRKKTFVTTIFLVIFCLVFITAPAGGADQITDGKRRAREEDKAMVIYFFSQYCSYCETMDHKVLGDKEISKILKKDLVYLRIDTDKNAEIAKKYAVRGYPTTILMGSDGKIIEKIPGYIEKKHFRIILFYLKGKQYRTMGLREFLSATAPR